MSAQSKRILEKLRRAQTRGRFPKSGLQLGAPISETDLQKFEADREIELPEAFREFLLEVGSGECKRGYGAGPGDGLSPLSDWDVLATSNSTLEVPSGQLALPCEWRVGKENSFAYWTHIDDPIEAEREWLKIAQGVLSVAAESHFEIGLIVSGPCRGHLVHFDFTFYDEARVSYEGSFLDWYERWLDELMSSYRMNGYGFGPRGTERELFQSLRGEQDRVRARDIIDTLRRMPDLAPTTVELIRKRHDELDLPDWCRV